MAEAQPVLESSDKLHERRIKRIFLMPAVLYLLLLSIFPLFWSLGISFTDYQRGGVSINDSC